MAKRIKLDLVDDPVGGVARTSLPVAKATPEPKQPRRERSTPRSPRRPEPSKSGTASERKDRTSPPAELAPRYAGEEKRAVFGRVPRSLNRRLERVVVELRDEFEDLTQEQVLAALLHEYVDPADPAGLARLTETVRRYRRELGRV
jgi:hypothetical protein